MICCVVRQIFKVFDYKSTFSSVGGGLGYGIVYKIQREDLHENLR